MGGGDLILVSAPVKGTSFSDLAFWQPIERVSSRSSPCETKIGRPLLPFLRQCSILGWSCALGSALGELQRRRTNSRPPSVPLPQLQLYLGRAARSGGRRESLRFTKSLNELPDNGSTSFFGTISLNISLQWDRKRVVETVNSSSPAFRGRKGVIFKICTGCEISRRCCV